VGAPIPEPATVLMAPGILVVARAGQRRRCYGCCDNLYRGCVSCPPHITVDLNENRSASRNTTNR
jgi:hypothetical protein